MNTLSSVTGNMLLWKPRGSQTEFCLLHISGVVDINTMLMKPPAPSFTCLFHSAEYFKQLWGATNTVAHSENMFVKIKSIVVSMSKACTKMQCYPHHYLLFLSTSSLPLYFPFYRSAQNSVSEQSNKAHMGVMRVISPSFVRLHCLLHFSSHC